MRCVTTPSFLLRGSSATDVGRKLEEVLERGTNGAVSAGPVAISAVSREEGALRAALSAALPAVKRCDAVREDGVYFEPAPFGARAVAFLFPGQGSQRARMLQPLADAWPLYTDAVHSLDALWASFAGESLAARIQSGSDDSLTATEVAQPALGLVSFAAAMALARAGVRPAFAAGHSYGELPALAVSGAFDGASLLRLSRERGLALAGAGARAPGGMLALATTEQDARSLVAGTSLAVANVNAPRQVVIAGALDAIDEAERRARAQGIRAVRLKTACAFHTAYMATSHEPWAAALRAAAVSAPTQAAVWSNVTARAYPAQAEGVRDLLARQVTEPVRWSETVEDLYTSGARIFVEVGPGEVLTNLTRTILGERPHLALALDPGPRDASAHVADLLARLASHGVPVEHAPFALAPAPRSPAPPAAFFDANRRAMELFFAQQERMATLAADLPAAERAALLERLVASNERAIGDFLDTQGRALPAARALEPASAAPLVEVVPPTRASHALPATVVTVPAADVEGVASLVLRTIVELTGFPAEVVRLDSELERDLGVDSVTMVEVYFKLLERYPVLEEHAARLRTCKDVRSLAAVVEEVTAGVAAETASPVSLSSAETVPAPLAEVAPVADVPLASLGSSELAELRSELSSAVSSAAGREGIDPAADLENDLGLDAFTREDVVEALLAKRPALALARRELLHARTLEDCLSVCSRILGCVQVDEGQAAEAAGGIDRFVRVEEPATLPEGAPPSRVLVVGEPGRVLDATCAALRGAAFDVTAVGIARSGWTLEGAPPCALEDDRTLAALLAPLVGPDAGVVFLALSERDALAELDPVLWAEQVERASVGLFVLAKALASNAKLPRALGVVLSGAAPAWAGARGVARSLAREWPGVCVRSLGVEPAFEPASAASIARVLLAPGPSEQDLVLRGAALQRLRLEPRAAATESGRRPLPSNALVLVLGGADGITAEVTYELARSHRCRFVAVGRTPMPAASPYAEVDDERTLKRVLYEELRASPDASDLPDGERLQRRLRTVLRQRAIWRTRSRVEAAGGTFLYHRADVSRPDELTAALAAIRAEHGPISGVVHGAGVTEDGLVTDKSVDSFRRVLHTKTESTFALYAALRDEPLRFAFLFSSLSAHAGTAGQTDYIAGNEVLQAVARVWNERAPYPARAILWSVWSEAGLASAGLKKQMERLGLQGIRNEDGARLFGRELSQSGTGDDWVLLAPESTLRFALRAGVKRLGEGVDHA